MKISIVVPIFNCEKYIKKCIESILKQSYFNIEVILVDDGSTDGSGIICDEYGSLDNRVRVIHKQNGGVSSARNSGLRLCTGEYVMFVDADDWLDIDACDKIISCIQSDCSLYMWGLRLYNNEKVEEIFKWRSWQFSRDVVSELIGGSRYQNSYLRACGGKVYKRSLLNDLEFPENIYIGEDACFLLDCIAKLERVDEIKLVNDGWYNYRIVSSSAVRRYKSDLYVQSKRQYNYILGCINKMHLENDISVKTSLTMFCWHIFRALKENDMKCKGKTKECLYWYENVKKHLIDRNVKKEEMSKFTRVCWELSKVFKPQIIEKMISFYFKYKK